MSVQLTDAPNMWTLISRGGGAARLYSLVAVFVPGGFPESYKMNMGVGPHFKAAAVIVALVFPGGVLNLRVRQRVRDAIRAPLANVKAGDRLRVRPRQCGARRCQRSINAC